MKVIIIGAVAAGMSAASKLKRMKPESEVVVYEKTDVVSLGACGLPYYVGGFFEDSNMMIARTAEKFKEAGIKLNIFKEVIGLDEGNQKVKIKDIKTGEVIEDSYDKLMIATGARSIIPPIKNVKLENVTTLKTLEDGIKVRKLFESKKLKDVVIIGAGFIGLEAVEAAKRYNKNITVIQATDRVLDRVFDKDITDKLEEELRLHEVDLRVNEFALELIGEKKVEKIITNKGEVKADIVIIATGVKPNTEFLKDTAVELLDNGAIIIDNQCRTSVKNIYSAGDCATIISAITGEDMYVPLATGANKLGRMVGENLAGAEKTYEGSLASSCIKVLNLEAAATGLTEEGAKAKGLNYKTAFITGYNQSHYYPGRNKMYIKLVYEAESKVLLGGQIAGYKDAVQRTNVIAAAIYGRLTTKQLGMMDLCYAPPFSESWDILNVAGNQCK